MDDPKVAASSSTRGAGQRTPVRESSIKETLESILIAFVLAFVFRAFVVEAFVIPTGSMAPTLLGAHMRFRCPDCGYQFEVNYSTEGASDDEISIPAYAQRNYRVRCPNCGYSLPESMTSGPEVHYGDRILVLKYLYLFKKPQRWDVVVFKSPDVKMPGDWKYDPNTPLYEQNYIKRLIGRPGESIVLLDGDVYVGNGADLSTYQIQTKPRYVQEALWRIIYDNDYYPQMRSRLDSWRQPWVVRSGSGWDLGGGARDGRVFRFSNDSGGATLSFDPSVNPATQGFTDWLAYDVEVTGAAYNVSDLKLSFCYERKSGEGPLRLKLNKRADTFVADITPGNAMLTRVTGGKQTRLGEAKLDMHAGPMQVEFTNHDYQVALRIDGKDVLKTTPQQYYPDVKKLLAEFDAGGSAPAPTVEITADHQQSALSHIGIWRDIYYINRINRQDRLPCAGGPKNPMHLGADEYFVLGDNSLISGDARYWPHPVDPDSENLHVGAGRVPGRFLLGRAFFVYWPAGFRPFTGAPPLAPDFGDMRFIH